MSFALAILLGFIVGFIVAFFYENLIPKITRKKQLILGGYKLHHSLYGLLFIILAILLKNNLTTAIFLMSMGVGIIMEHYFTGGGFDFITKVS